ncbi:hypothetical protein EV702DRAFT_1040751 [Suillus placidus]|uniref:Uncharacterized protein n=1 Tax=Suillus placidus TaxID=48579 RepID=A0A9P7D8I4_9AGAM|nr:hypothetical protein EV702DRAFT_1040751 [Suillus placidus]
MNIFPNTSVLVNTPYDMPLPMQLVTRFCLAAIPYIAMQSNMNVFPNTSVLVNTPYDMPLPMQLVTLLYRILGPEACHVNPKASKSTYVNHSAPETDCLRPGQKCLKPIRNTKYGAVEHAAVIYTIPHTHMDSGPMTTLVQKNAAHYHTRAVARFVEVRELVELVYQHLPCLTDVVAWGDTCHAIRKYKGELVTNRFKSIVAPFAPDNFKQSCNVLDDAKAIITGSCAITVFLGPSSQALRDLNILMTPQLFKVLEAFFLHKLGYFWIDCTAIPHDALLHAVDRFVRYKLDDWIVTISVVNDVGLFRAVVCSPCTADMIAMTAGRICSFYPKLTMDNVAILSPGGFLVEPEYAVGSIWSEWFTMYDNSEFLGTDCGLYCPSLWRGVVDGNLSRVVEWDHRFSMGEHLQKSHTIWRLSETCTNPLCSFRVIPGRYRPLLPPQTMPSDLNAIEDQSFLVKRHSFTSPVTFTALLYATAATSPHKVPVGLQEGKQDLRSLDDLEINFWVNTLARDKYAVPMNRYRRTFSAIPDGPDLKLLNSYTIVREDPEGYPPPNALMKTHLQQSALNDTLKGNILVLKHVNHNRRQLADVTDGDVSIINLLLHGGALRRSHWPNFK